MIKPEHITTTTYQDDSTDSTVFKGEIHLTLETRVPNNSLTPDKDFLGGKVEDYIRSTIMKEVYGGIIEELRDISLRILPDMTRMETEWVIKEIDSLINRMKG